MKIDQYLKCVNYARVFIRYRGLKNSVYYAEFTSLCLVANDYFYSDVEPLSKYSPVILHLSLLTRILHENPAMLFCLFLTLYI